MKECIKDYFDFTINAIFAIHKNEAVRLVDQIHAMDNSIEISWVSTLESLKVQGPDEALENLSRLKDIAEDMDGKLVAELGTRINSLYDMLSKLVAEVDKAPEEKAT